MIKTTDIRYEGILFSNLIIQLEKSQQKNNSKHLLRALSIPNTASTKQMHYLIFLKD